MEHILQFGINIDDDAIIKAVENRVTNEVKTEIKQRVKDKLFNSWGDFTPNMRNILREVLTDYKEEIISRASEEVANSMKRSKKYKEALASIVEEMEK